MVEQLDTQLSCILCLDLCTNAMETGCCHQLLCEGCSTNIRTCPACRAEPFTVCSSPVIRRLIGSMPAQCTECGYKTTRDNIKNHDNSCPVKPLKCMQANCGFVGPRDKVLEHVTSTHPSELVKLFTTVVERPPTQDRDCVGRKGSARIGSSGKYYCGNSLNSSCSCCDGYCGPTNGCNCESCMRLDVEARALPAGHLVNKEGRTSRPGSSRAWYCGAKVMQGVPRCDGWCGPSDGPQCQACQILQAQVGSRYVNIANSWSRR